jgi:hypothetical protein
MDEETWLISSPNQPDLQNEKDSEELEHWLQGAAKKIDFQTRSALSRRLQKRKMKKEAATTARLSQVVDKALEKIEETSAENGSDSPRNKSVERTNQSKEESDSDNEIFFDAHSDGANTSNTTGKNIPLPLSEKLNVVMEQDEKLIRSTDSLTKSYSYDQTTPIGSQPSTANGRPIQEWKTPTSRQDTNGYSTRQTQERLPRESIYVTPPTDGQPQDLQEIERRAKQQEEELHMELLNLRRDRVCSSQSDRTPQSRPTSSSSTSSSVNPLTTSRSVDFRTANCMSLPRSADGSLSDLSSVSHPGSASRLPVLRRPMVNGRSNIPMPAPSRLETPKASTNRAYTRTLTGYTYRQSSVPKSYNSMAMGDDDCF